MQILDIHERELQSTLAQIGALIDSLASGMDRLWPDSVWPRMQFDRPLVVGARGGHGPIRYYIEEYQPGKSIRFRFTGPKGFDGFHGFDIQSGPDGCSILRRTLKMNARGPARLSWPLVFRPLHDALLEDSLAKAQASLGEMPQFRAWSLRWLVTGGRALPQVVPYSPPG